MFCITFHDRSGFGDISKRNLTGYTFALLMFANITHPLLWFYQKPWLDNLNTCVCSQPKGVNFHRHMYDPISDGHNQRL